MCRSSRRGRAPPVLGRPSAGLAGTSWWRPGGGCASALNSQAANVQENLRVLPSHHTRHMM
eukprot:4675505-Pyramimonas_sp.AAC.1